MQKTRGFTLIELLVVIAIIGILSSVVLASLNTARARARDARRVSDITQIRTALELYYSDNGAYPVSTGAGSDRSCWVQQSTDTSCHPLGILKTNGYMPAVPYDPGTNTYTATSPCEGSQFYAYSSNGTTFMLAAAQETKTGSCVCNFGFGNYQFCKTN